MSALEKIIEILLAIVAGSKEKQSKSGTRAPGASSPSPQRERSAPPPPPFPSRPAADPGTDIRSWVGDWQGVPYRIGSTDRSGIDCSGLVRAMYSDLFGCPLPRTSCDQVLQGREVSRNNLAPGDLVFFRLNERTRHVSAYVGSDKFGHASTTKGPMVSSLDSDYWKKRFWTARRVLARSS